MALSADKTGLGSEARPEALLTNMSLSCPVVHSLHVDSTAPVSEDRPEAVLTSVSNSRLNLYRCCTSTQRASRSRQMRRTSASLTGCSRPCWSARPPCQRSMSSSTASTTSTLTPPPSSLCSRWAASVPESAHGLPMCRSLNNLLLRFIEGYGDLFWLWSCVGWCWRNRP